MDVSGWIHCCYRSTLATLPVCRTDKPGWYAEHVKHIELSKNSRVGHVLLIGDDFIESLAHHPRVWSKYFGPLQALNFGLRGDRTQHILWRVETGAVPVNAETIIIHAGVNNLVCDHSRDIANGIGCIALMCLKHKPNARILLCGLLPCDISRKKKIRNVNRYLKLLCSSGYISNCVYVKPDDDWFLPDGSLNLLLYRNGFSEDGMDKFAKPIKDVINNLNDGVKVEMSSDDSEVSTDEDVGSFPVNASLYSAKSSMKATDKPYRFPIRQKRKISYSSNDSFRSRSHSLKRHSISADHKRKTSHRSRQSSSSRSRSRSRSSRSRSSSRPISPVFTGQGSRSRSRSISPVFTARGSRSRSRSRCKSKSRSTSRSAERKRWIERAQQKVCGDATDSFELISTWSISRSGSPAANSPATKSSKNEKHSMKRVVNKKKVPTSAPKEDKNSTKKKSSLTTKENDGKVKKKSPPTSTQKDDNGITKKSVPISLKEDGKGSKSSSSPSLDKAIVNTKPPSSTSLSNSKTPLPAAPDPEAEKTQHMYDKFLEELEQINKKETNTAVQSGNGELNGKVMETA